MGVRARVCVCESVCVCVSTLVCVRPQIIAYMQQREDDLMFQVDNLSKQLESAVSRTLDVSPPCC